MSEPSHTPTIRNRRARHDYLILGTVEAGIALVGCEVKSIRQGQANLTDAYAKIDERCEVWLIGLYITPYKQGGTANAEPTRKRKLLLHEAEIRRLKREVDQKGKTLVPLSLHFSRGLVKVELGICQGKRQHDKRDALMERDLERQAAREMVGRGQG
jgi:SsrA-binding protein